MNEIQIIGENLITAYLQSLGHVIVGRNTRFGALEADIITRYKNKSYITEVRTVTSSVIPYVDIFPQTKIVTLLHLLERHYPTATLLCFLVRHLKYKTIIQKINPYLLL